MTFLIVTHVEHSRHEGNYYAYGPYVREMNLWTKNTDKVIIIAPLNKGKNPGSIDLRYNHPYISFMHVPAFEITSPIRILRALVCIPYIMILLGVGMLRTDHIHLRCPGNMGLLGSFIQILFPRKKKTAKYAGNWDWNSSQPWSYRLQQRILRNTSLTHNCKTLVYGEWPDRNKNILPFFTASYTENDMIRTQPKVLEKNSLVKFMFVGTLTEGKRPLETLRLVHALKQQLTSVELHFFGEGNLKEQLSSLVHELKMTDEVFIHGNVNAEVLKTAYQHNHFLILLSDSEGWPKAIAEAMWWGCVPVATPVSCVRWMLGNEQRGIIINNSKDPAIVSLISLISQPSLFTKKSGNAMEWARQYTLEKFERNIQELL